ncbi:hypothetical protein BHYA_0033g00130 [Botrytis hyacinthi]|uniref:Uncharacterized protein n=1 Tax=Botrytis hyacinthi TaxID=278943 RepID=A0A4Z1H007_9HELO|nr:hypothetical protein BHYA_0033g00130 [Botrytis hyacinthi]
MDTCDFDAARNSSNWKTGVTRITRQENVWFHPEEFKSFSGPSNKQVILELHIRNITDGIGNDIPLMVNGEYDSKDTTKVAGDGNPYIFNTTLPFPIVITPELNGNPSDYIQFVYGSQSLTTSVNSEMPNCSVGGWTNPGTSLGAISFSKDSWENYLKSGEAGAKIQGGRLHAAAKISSYDQKDIPYSTI